MDSNAKEKKVCYVKMQSRIWKSIEIFISVSLLKCQISVDILNEMEIGIHT